MTHGEAKRQARKMAQESTWNCAWVCSDGNDVTMKGGRWVDNSYYPVENDDQEADRHGGPCSPGAQRVERVTVQY